MSIGDGQLAYFKVAVARYMQGRGCPYEIAVAAINMNLVKEVRVAFVVHHDFVVDHTHLASLNNSNRFEGRAELQSGSGPRSRRQSVSQAVPDKEGTPSVLQGNEISALLESEIARRDAEKLLNDVPNESRMTVLKCRAWLKRRNVPYNGKLKVDDLRRLVASVLNKEELPARKRARKGKGERLTRKLAKLNQEIKVKQEKIERVKVKQEKIQHAKVKQESSQTRNGLDGKLEIAPWDIKKEGGKDDLIAPDTGNLPLFLGSLSSDHNAPSSSLSSLSSSSLSSSSMSSSGSG